MLPIPPFDPIPESISIIGIDPGTSGAIALLTARSLTIFDIPTATLKRGGKVRTRADVPALVSLLTALASLGACEAVVEDVGGLPKQSASASFNFGRCCGQIEAALAAAAVPITFSAPGSWKHRARLIGKSKDASRELATKLFPLQAAMFARKKDDGRAEAALIAVYGRK
jgi:crossover junction endodeoxyribonuclease RuvC